jgi:hypothetical protein
MPECRFRLEGAAPPPARADRQSRPPSRRELPDSAQVARWTSVTARARGERSAHRCFCLIAIATIVERGPIGSSCGRRRAYAPDATGRAEWRFCCSSLAGVSAKIVESAASRAKGKCASGSAPPLQSRGGSTRPPSTSFGAKRGTGSCCRRQRDVGERPDELSRTLGWRQIAPGLAGSGRLASVGHSRGEAAHCGQIRSTFL